MPELGVSTSQNLRFHVTNFYHERDGKPGALIPWLRDVELAEPYVDTTLRVVEPLDGYSYQWTIRSIPDDEVLATASGAEAVVQFTRLDENAVTLEEKDASGSITRELTETVMVKYVRREIRTLTDEDRDDLFDAVSTLPLPTLARVEGIIVSV